MGAVESLSVEKTSVCVGDYEILQPLAKGGMAEVFLARAQGAAGFEKLIALKRLLPEFARDPYYASMFIHEARLLALLCHPNIVRVFDFGESEGTYLLAMEHLQGVDARGLVRHARKSGEPIPLEHSIAVALDAAAGLHYAHEQVGNDGAPLHIVHRDVSPSNLIVTFSGDVKLIDFGIARTEMRDGQTRVGEVKGKPHYMAPEQAIGVPVDRRADVYALGVVLYELTTGHHPFRDDGASPLEVFARVAAGRCQPPSSYVLDYPRELQAIVLRAMALRPEDRYRTADAMRADLHSFARRQGLLVSRAALAEYARSIADPSALPQCAEEPATRSTILLPRGVVPRAPTLGEGTSTRTRSSLPEPPARARAPHAILPILAVVAAAVAAFLISRGDTTAQADELEARPSQEASDAARPTSVILAPAEPPAIAQPQPQPQPQPQVEVEQPKPRSKRGRRRAKKRQPPTVAPAADPKPPAKWDPSSPLLPSRLQ